MVNPVGAAQKAHAAQSAQKNKATGSYFSRGGVGTAGSSIASAQKSSNVLAPVKTAISNVVAAIRKILSYIPILGRLFVAKATPAPAAQLTKWEKAKEKVRNAFSYAVNSRPVQFAKAHKLAMGGSVVVAGAAAATYAHSDKIADLYNQLFPVSGAKPRSRKGS